MLSKDEQISQLRESAETALKRLYKAMRTIQDLDYELFDATVTKVSDHVYDYNYPENKAVNVLQSRLDQLELKEKALNKVMEIIRGF